MDFQQFEGRKREHLQLALDPENQTLGQTGLDQVHLFHDALPELNLGEIDLSTPCLGRILPTPFFISGMTAGHAHAVQINALLARSCEERGWALGLGSMRRDLEGGGGIDGWKALRDKHPSLMIFANLGLSQLVRSAIENIQSLVESIRADALVIHCNALQEALQPEGTPEFRGGVAALRDLSSKLRIPVVLKETGCGFSLSTLQKVRGLGLSAIDLSGRGGTHWGRIEGKRTRATDISSGVSRTFENWGESTVESLRSACQVFRPIERAPEIWASGGVRSGLDAAKLLALGAHRVGYAQPALEAALEGRLPSWMELQERELRVALLCTGSASPTALRQKEGAWKITTS